MSRSRSGWSYDPAADRFIATGGAGLEPPLELWVPSHYHAFQVRLTTQAPAGGRAGLRFGLSDGLSSDPNNRGVELFFSAGGSLATPRLLGPEPVFQFQPGRPVRLRLVVDPSIGAFRLYANGRLETPEPQPFNNSVPRLDTLFFQAPAGGSGAVFSGVSVEGLPAPGPPYALQARLVWPRAVQITWTPGEGALPDAYRIARDGVPLATVDAGHTAYLDPQPPAAAGVTYTVTAEGPPAMHQTARSPDSRDSLPTWPVHVVLPALAESSRSGRRRRLADVGGPPGGTDPLLELPNLLPTIATSRPHSAARPPEVWDLVVVGATPGGIATAIAAARAGLRVLLLEPTDHLGGMMAGGLGQTDFRSKLSAGGLFLEFLNRMRAYYLSAFGPSSREWAASNQGYRFEPGIAEQVLAQMVQAEPRIQVCFNTRVISAIRRGRRLLALRIETAPCSESAPGPAPYPLRGSLQITHQNSPASNPGAKAPPSPGRPVAQSPSRLVNPSTSHPLTSIVRARFFADATYEGDLAALAGAAYRIGRESRSEYGEAHAGVIYWWNKRQAMAPGSTGDGDRKVQAYTYRVTLTNRPRDRRFVARPRDYHREWYLPLIADVRSGRVKSIAQAIYLGPLPEEKMDVNNHVIGSVSTDFVGESSRYPEAGARERARIAAMHRDYVLGLLYFLQNDPALPSSFRYDASQWGLAEDEYPDTGHFPFQLYVREARRVTGLYTFTENDAIAAPGQERPRTRKDAVAIGEYPMDSHATGRARSEGSNLEGFFFLGSITRPYQIPYGILVARDLDNLLIPVPVSATHVGAGTLRLEPIYMAMGQAAGTAAALALRHHRPLQRVDLTQLQDRLLDGGQLLTFFQDVPPESPWFRALEFLGTRGFFPNYHAEPNAPVTAAQAAAWIRLTAADRGLSPPAPASMTPNPQALLTRAAARRLLSDLAAQIHRRRRALLPGGPDGAPVSRGEFCDALYRAIYARKGFGRRCGTHLVDKQRRDQADCPIIGADGRSADDLPAGTIRSPQTSKALP